MSAGELGWWGVLLAVLGGAIRVSTPYLFVSLGETLTEKSGRVNLGLEGTLLMGAMSGYGVSYLTGSPWLGVLAAAAAGALLGLLHAAVSNLPRVNDIAVGIALFIFGTGLAFFLGKPFVQPQAPRLPTIALGGFSELPAVRAALEVSPLFFLGIVLAIALRWFNERGVTAAVLEVGFDGQLTADAIGCCGRESSSFGAGRRIAEHQRGGDQPGHDRHERRPQWHVHVGPPRAPHPADPTASVEHEHDACRRR